MKKIIIATCLLCIGAVNAQVKMGDNPTTLNANSLLELESTNKGLLLPRLALTATNNAAPLSAHVQGMVIYNTATAGSAPNNVTPGYYFNNGSSWQRIATAAELANIYTADGTLSGNRTVAQANNNINFTNTATTGTSHFTVDGTTLNVDAVNNRVGIGTAAPTAPLNIVRDNTASANDDNVDIDSYATNPSPQINFNSSQGTLASPQNLTNGNLLGSIFFGGRWAGSRNFSGAIVSEYKGNGTTSLSNLRFLASGSERLRIDENGRVGIGTIAPSSIFHVSQAGNGTASVNGTSTNLSILESTSNSSSTGLVFKSLNSAGAAKTVAMGVNPNFSSNDGLFTVTDNGGSDYFTINLNNRNIGIGTTTPLVSLDTRGSIHFDDTTTAATANQQGGYLTWNRANVGGVGSPNGGHVGFLNHQGTGSGGFVFTVTNNNTTFNERMRITGAGNVGIGTSSPSERLDVSGNVRFSGALMPNNNAGTSGQILESRGAGTPPVFVNKGFGESETFTVTVAAGATSTVTLNILAASPFGANYKLYVSAVDGCGFTFFDEYMVTGSDANAAWRILPVAGLGTASTVATSFSTTGNTISATRIRSSCLDGGTSTASNYTIVKATNTKNFTITNNGTLTRQYSVRVVSY